MVEYGKRYVKVIERDQFSGPLWTINAVNKSEGTTRVYNFTSEEKFLNSEEDETDASENLNDLPEAKPGHSLIQPEENSLVSSVKYNKDGKMLVYGNLNNLAITWGKTKDRVLSTGFRKANDVLDTLLSYKINKNIRKPLLVYIQGQPETLKKKSGYGRQVSEEQDNASEILDDEELFGRADINNFRRKYEKGNHYKYRHRESSDSGVSSDLTDTSSGSSEYERNPGNPYTVFKDKYLQNWMWNHEMDGDHMNVNPYAPQFSNAGPSGAALFFNRKWWYYNQDDYRPFD